MTQNRQPLTLDEPTLLAAVDVLAAADTDLARIVERHGAPPLWPREPGFETLVRIILEQQVSLTSGEAAFRRLERAAGAVEPRAVHGLGEPGMRAAGITRQKARYLVAFASAVDEGRLELDALVDASDDEVRRRLIELPGIGPWTADVYLLLALRRADIWPVGAMALAASVGHVKRLATRPGPAEMATIGESWRPWRAVAARLLWHAYLSGDRSGNARDEHDVVAVPG